MKGPGEECKLYYDTSLTVEAGDAIETSTGRRYLVVAARKSPSKTHRWNLDCVVMAGGDPVPGNVHPLYWYSRRRKIA